MSSDSGPLYLGFDLSTQQLKAIVITSDLKVLYEAKADFDADLSKYGIQKGVHVNSSESEVYAPVAMWIEALDLVLQRLKEKNCAFERIKGISGAGQQHGSVYWSEKAEEILGSLKGEKRLVEQLDEAFSWKYSPNWQDASTQRECDAFDKELGSPEKLAEVTGSGAHHVSLNFTPTLSIILLFIEETNSKNRDSPDHKSCVSNVSDQKSTRPLPV